MADLNEQTPQRGKIEYITDESKWPEYVRRLSKSAAAASQHAIEELFAAGIPAVFARDGKLVKQYPDGHEEILKEVSYK